MIWKSWPLLRVEENLLKKRQHISVFRMYAVMMSGIRSNIPDTAYIYGSRGHIELPVFWKPTEIHVFSDQQERREEFPVPQHVDDICDEGFQYEIAHVNAYIRAGRIESDISSFSKTLEVLGQCDALRKDWGIQFPTEKTDR